MLNSLPHMKFSFFCNLTLHILKKRRSPVVFYHRLIFLEYSKPPASYLRRLRLFRARLSMPETPLGNHQKLSVLHARQVSEQPFERQASCHNKLNKVRIANGQTVCSAFSRERLEGRFDQAALGVTGNEVERC